MYFFIMKRLSALTTGMERGWGGGGGGQMGDTQIKWAIYTYNQYNAHELSSFIALLISFVLYFKIVIHYFQFVNLPIFFSLPIHPYVSVNSNWVHLHPRQPPAKLFERANPGHLGILFVQFPCPEAKMMDEFPGVGQNFPKLEETVS